ncbi:MAG: acyl-CoA dehydrogenase family protein, partial [Anaerovoracaceae bacterium]
MDFSYSEEQLRRKKQIQEFNEKEVKPILSLMEKEAIYPLESVKKLGKMGYMGMPFPKKYGGMELDYVSYVMVIEELSKVSPSHGVIVQTHNALS